MLSFLFENGFWEGERFDFETENDSSRNRDQKKDFDLSFENLSINRSWLTFEIENSEIKNAKKDFFSELKTYFCNSV